MLVWSNSGRAGAWTLAGVLILGVYALPMTVIALASLAGQWNGVLPSKLGFSNYIAALHRQRPDVTLTLVVPEIVVAKRWQRILHNRIATRLRASLIAYDGIVITTVPFHLAR